MRWLVVTLVAFCVLIAARSILGTHEMDLGAQALPMLLISLTLAAAYTSIVTPVMGPVIALDRPGGFYAIFFVLYYVVPFALLLFSESLPTDRESPIAGLILLGMGAWLFGSQRRDTGVRKRMSLRLAPLDAWTLYYFCLAGIGAIAYTYGWRISHGVFYTHAKLYVQEMSLAASFRDVFADSLQLPIILLLGLVVSQESSRLRLVAKRTLILYSAGIFVVHIGSSQTRLAITDLIFLMASVNLFAPGAIKWRHMLAAAAAGASALIVIQVVRLSVEQQLVNAQNQLTYAIQNAIPAAIGQVTGESDSNLGGQVSSSAMSRAGAGIVFLSDVMGAVAQRGEYLRGSGLARMLPILVPRAVWRDKPSFSSPQIVTEDILGLTLNDTSLLPVTQFYVEGGPLAVFVGYAIFGLFIAVLTKHCWTTQRLSGWFVLVFVWSNAAQVEQELIIGTLGTMRAAILIALLYHIVVGFMRAGRVSGGAPRQRAIVEPLFRGRTVNRPGR